MHISFAKGKLVISKPELCDQICINTLLNEHIYSGNENVNRYIEKTLYFNTHYDY